MRKEQEVGSVHNYFEKVTFVRKVLIPRNTSAAETNTMHYYSLAKSVDFSEKFCAISVEEIEISYCVHICE